MCFVGDTINSCSPVLMSPHPSSGNKEESAAHRDNQAANHAANDTRQDPIPPCRDCRSDRQFGREVKPVECLEVPMWAPDTPQALDCCLSVIAGTDLGLYGPNRAQRWGVQS
jgi:hypothetical protein